MARIDDYEATFDIAAREFTGRDMTMMAERADALVVEGDKVLVPFLGRKYLVGGDPVEVTPQDGGDDPHVTAKGLILHYLLTADGILPKGEWATYREVPSGEFYWDAFCRRAKDPLVKTFGHQGGRLVELASKLYGAEAGDLGSHSAIVEAFPRVKVALVIWEGDDEFPPEGNLLFDQHVSHYLSTEDVAVLSGMIVYPLLGAAFNPHYS